MKHLAIYVAIYAIPAVIFFGMTIGAARLANRDLILPIERAAWLLPGLVYAFVPVLIWKLEMSTPPKGLLNLIDPVLIALLCGFVFIGRVRLGLRRPEMNRRAAYATIGVNMSIALAVLLFVPPLPQ